MKALCITVPVAGVIEPLAERFAAAGVVLEDGQEAFGPLTVPKWQARVLAQAEGKGEVLAAIGKFWEKLAADIFERHLDDPVWGWLDENSLSFLEIWRQFDSAIFFVLIATDPFTYLYHTLQHSGGKGDPAAILAHWQETHRTMLRFALRYPQRSIFIDLHQLMTEPAAALAALAERFNLSLSHDALTALTDDPIDPIFAHFVSELLARNLDAEQETLYEELKAAGALGERDLFFPEPQELIAVLVERQAQANGTRQSLEQTQKTLKEVQKENKLILAQFHQVQEEHDLILAQLHQVQEELERYVLSMQQTQQTLAGVQQQHEEAKRLVAELTQERERLQQAVAEKEAERGQLAQALEAVRGELGQSKGQLEAVFGDLEQTRGQLQFWQQEAQKVTEERDAARLSLQVTQQTLKEVQQENELILAQLHQVQEELEHYFLSYQEEKQKVAAEQQRSHQESERWQKVLRRHPEFVDWTDVQVTEVVAGNEPRLRCQYREPIFGGRAFPEFTFDIILDKQIAGLLFPPVVRPHFRRWPKGMETLEILPAPHPDPVRAQQRLATLISLATSDWRLVRQVVTLAQKTVEQNETIDSTTRSRYLQGLQTLAAVLDKLPNVLRFDRVSLKQQHHTPDYDQLWIVIEGLAVNGKTYDPFEFRLACANTRPTFGVHPRLEFPPPQGVSPWRNWFVESQDDFGEKCELRFALPNAMDLNVWQILGEDREWLVQLIGALPALIDSLAEENVIDWIRPVADWQALAQQILAITKTHLAAS